MASSDSSMLSRIHFKQNDCRKHYEVDGQSYKSYSPGSGITK
jgi:hypothetical protein